MTRLLIVAIGAAALAAAGVVLAPRADAVAVPAYHPTRLAHVADAQQLIVVTGRSKTSSYSTLRTYEKTVNGSWTEKFAAMPARNGDKGWAVGTSRVQGTRTSPQGTYRITTAFGVKPNPGAKLSYRLADHNDYWVGDQRDPKTYNLVQSSASAKRTWRIGEAEKLSSYPRQYEYAAVIDFNRPAASTVKWNATHSEYVTTQPVNVALGSAIFLHINGKAATAGCVSLNRTDMISVLKWLDPSRKPRIVMAPESEIGKA